MCSGKAWIACLGLLLGACAYQPSESEVAFSDLRIGMRVRNQDPMAECAEISYTKTSHLNHEVWNWKDGSGRSVYVDNGILTTINGVLPSITK
jgi:hypothetical protein